MPRILCAGLIAVDLVFEVEGFPIKGTKHRAPHSQLITGGGALNAATAIAALGGEASLVGTIGDDIFGEFLRQKMSERGIDDSLVRTLAGVATSRSANMITPDGDRTIVNHREAKLGKTALDIPPGFPFDAALVDTRLPETAERIVASANRNGKPAVVDAEAPVAQAQAALTGASYVIFSEQGLADFCEGEGPQALASAAAKLRGWCAVTRGANSVLCHDGQTLTEVPAFPTTALNTLGAGDMWHAAFTFALCGGRSEIEATRWANAAASLKVSRPLQDEHWPSAVDVDALISETQNGTGAT